MKKLITVLGLLMVCQFAAAQDFDFTLKQGALFTWEDQQIKNLTTLEVVKTKPVANWGKWNALWSGNTLDVGWAYDSSNLTSCALLIGRELGTLADYLPLEYPFAKQIHITIYPVGLYVESIFDHPRIQGATGGAMLKLNVKF